MYRKYLPIKHFSFLGKVALMAVISAVFFGVEYALRSDDPATVMATRKMLVRLAFVFLALFGIWMTRDGVKRRGSGDSVYDLIFGIIILLLCVSVTAVLLLNAVG